MRQGMRMAASLLAAVAMVPSSTAWVFAQTASGHLRFTPPAGKKGGKPATPPQAITEPVEFPGVPRYTGRFKMLRGLRYKSAAGGDCYGMTIGVQEEGQQVLDWYKTSLQAYGWTLAKTSPEQPVVAAKQGPCSFTVMISPAREIGFRTVVDLSFASGK